MFSYVSLPEKKTNKNDVGWFAMGSIFFFFVESQLKIRVLNIAVSRRIYWGLCVHFLFISLVFFFLLSLLLVRFVGIVCKFYFGWDDKFQPKKWTQVKPNQSNASQNKQCQMEWNTKIHTTLKWKQFWEEKEGARKQIEIKKK